MNSDFMLNELTNYTELLQHVKTGTLSWNRFYKIGNYLYELVLETYYVNYKEDPQQLNTSLSFRAGSLIEISVGVFEIHVVKEKTFLSDRHSFFELYPKRNIRSDRQNIYDSSDFITKPPIHIVFNSNKNKNQQFQFFLKDMSTEENETENPKIERLPRNGYRNYMFKNDEKYIRIEIPTYYIGQKAELSMMLISLKFSVEDSIYHLGEKYSTTIYKYKFAETNNYGFLF